MKFQEVNIATARIKGLEKPPYYFEHHCYYVWDIMFEDTSTFSFRNLPFIKVGDTKEEGEIFCNQLKENFKEAHIYDGDKVAVIFGVTVVFWQSAAWEKMHGLIQLTNLLRKLSQNSILLLNL